MSQTVAAPGFQASAYFEYLEECLKEQMIREIALGTVKAVLVVTIKNKENKQQTWILDFKDKGSVVKAESEQTPPKVTFSLF